MDAVIYCRVSDPRQARDGVSLAVQEQDCRALAERNQDRVVRVFIDAGVSGKSLERGAMQELLAMLEADGARVVYVWSLDRFSRDIVDQISICRVLQNRGQLIRSVRQNLDYSTPDGRTITHVLASFAQGEREKLRDRVMAAQTEKIARGEPLSQAPYGYSQGTGAHFEVNAEEAAVVREIFHRYNSGEAISRIAQSLTDRGVPARRSSMWRRSMVRKVLSGRAYTGLLTWGEHVYEGAHEPLVSRETFRRAQAQLERRSRIHPRTVDTTLSCCFRCGVCGGRVVTITGSRRRNYCCGDQREDRNLHESVFTSTATVDAVVWAHVREVLSAGEVEAGAEALAEQLRSEAAKSARRELVAELSTVQTRIRRNLEAYHAEAIDLNLLREQNEPLQARQAELEAALEREAALLEGPSPGALRRLTRGSIDAALSTENVDRQHQVLELLFEPIEIGADRTLTIRARWPAEPVVYAIPRYYSPARGVLFELANLRL